MSARIVAMRNMSRRSAALQHHQANAPHISCLNPPSAAGKGATACTPVQGSGAHTQAHAASLCIMPPSARILAGWLGGPRGLSRCRQACRGMQGLAGGLVSMLCPEQVCLHPQAGSGRTVSGRRCALAAVQVLALVLVSSCVRLCPGGCPLPSCQLGPAQPEPLQAWTGGAVWLESQDPQVLSWGRRGCRGVLWASEGCGRGVGALAGCGAEGGHVGAAPGAGQVVQGSSEVGEFVQLSCLGCCGALGQRQGVAGQPG